MVGPVNFSVWILPMDYLLKHFLVEETMFSMTKMGPNIFKFNMGWFDWLDMVCFGLLECWIFIRRILLHQP